MHEVAGICWPLASTVGHITVTSNLIRGHFPAQHGNNAMVCCDLAPAGKYRNGAKRTWCRTHQAYWGVKADLAAMELSGIQRCAQHADPMGYVLQPRVVDLGRHEHLDITCSSAGLMTVDGTPVAAIAIAYDPATRIFDDDTITQVNITPPAMLALATALHQGKTIGCVNCSKCRHPHLDLGKFSAHEHRRHYCGNCGHDGTHSKEAIVSTPLFALTQFYRKKLRLSVSSVPSHPVL